MIPSGPKSPSASWLSPMACYRFSPRMPAKSHSTSPSTTPPEPHPQTTRRLRYLPARLPVVPPDSRSGTRRPDAAPHQVLRLRRSRQGRHRHWESNFCLLPRRRCWPCLRFCDPSFARLHRTLEPATQGLFDLALDAFLRFGSLGFRRSRLPPPNSTGADLWVLSGSKSPPANQGFLGKACKGL